MVRLARRRSRARLLALALPLLAATPAVAASPAPDAPWPALRAGDAIDPRWGVVGLPRQAMPMTRYAADAVDGEAAAVRLDAERSYGHLAARLGERPAPAVLRWRWRVPAANPGTALARREGDDTPARVCLGFALPLERVPFGDRQRLRIARTLADPELPAATLCWAWGGSEPAGTLVVNPYTARVRTIVLRGAADAGERWHQEQRDVHADFRRAFGDEWTGAAPPPVVVVFVAADADNTGARTRAWVAGLGTGERP
jgi:hypothetical protein